MATKLKKLLLKSVDLVRAGANQEADIRIFKSENPPEVEEELTEAVEKDFTTFNSAKTNLENHEKLWQYQDALRQSIRSIVDDRELTQAQRLQYFRQSLKEFDEAMLDLFSTLCEEAEANTPEPMEKSDRYDEIEEVTKTDRYDHIEEVQKFNINHDPKTGRFTSGSTSGGVASRTISNGGISVHVKTGKEPKTGYMVAVYGERSQWLKGDDVTDPGKREAAIKSFMEKNKDVLSDPDNYLGTWFDTESGNISLDISRNFSDKGKAIKYASEHNEKAIWDIENMSEIPTGGTGNNL